MRHSLGRTHFTHTKRVDTNIRHRYYFKVKVRHGWYSHSAEYTLKEANECAWEIAQHYKVPLFEVTIERTK